MCVFTARLSRIRVIVSTTRTTRSYRSREATAWRDTTVVRIPQCIGAIPMPGLRWHWRREFRPICQ